MKKSYPRYVRSLMGFVKLCRDEADENQFTSLEIKTAVWALAIQAPILAIILAYLHIKK